MTAALQAEVERLRARVRDLEGGKWYWPANWKLTQLDTEILRLLVRRGLCSPAFLMDALYWDRMEPPGENIVRVVMARLRRKLAPHGFAIATRWGIGYEIAGSDRKTLQQIAEGAQVVAN